MNKYLETFDRLDLPKTSEDYLHQIDAHIVCTMGEQPFDSDAYNQWQKKRYIQCSLSLESL